MLEIEQLNTYYDRVHVLRDVAVSIRPGSVVCVIGANGAGKTTLINSISGIIEHKKGRIRFEGKEISSLPPERIVRLGICQVPEGRRVFGSMTVLENLELGSYAYSQRKRKEEILDRMEFVYALFPRLRERVKQKAGSMSGGEQQMLAIGRALMGRPRLLLLDEPSMGLAPLIVKEVFGVIQKMQTEGITVLLVEQNARGALKISDHAYVLENGMVVHEGEASSLLKNGRIAQAYLGND